MGCQCCCFCCYASLAIVMALDTLMFSGCNLRLTLLHIQISLVCCQKQCQSLLQGLLGGTTALDYKAHWGNPRWKSTLIHMANILLKLFLYHNVYCVLIIFCLYLFLFIFLISFSRDKVKDTCRTRLRVQTKKVFCDFG